MNDDQHMKEALSDLGAMALIIGVIALVMWVMGEGLVRIASDLTTQ